MAGSGAGDEVACSGLPVRISCREGGSLAGASKACLAESRTCMPGLPLRAVACWYHDAAKHFHLLSIFGSSTRGRVLEGLSLHSKEHTCEKNPEILRLPPWIWAASDAPGSGTASSHTVSLSWTSLLCYTGHDDLQQD